jgi:hypothetical protein
MVFPAGSAVGGETVVCGRFWSYLVVFLGSVAATNTDIWTPCRTVGFWELCQCQPPYISDMTLALGRPHFWGKWVYRKCLNAGILQVTQRLVRMVPEGLAQGR